MEITKTKAVKLRSHLDKYLTADADHVSVRQSRKSDTRNSTWLVIPSPIVAGAFRLKNQGTGLYLTASDVPFLLGVTGKKVVQAEEGRGEVDWTAERDGFMVRLRTAEGEGRVLRGNGGTPPWRNSVTHDLVAGGAAGEWSLWDLEAVEAVVEEEEEGFPTSVIYKVSANKCVGMEFFTNDKLVRLRSHHAKYLTAGGGEDSVTQHRSSTTRTSLWTVELTGPTLIRLKSCHGKYLTASSHPFLLGMTGSKVLLTLPQHLKSSSSVEWEPVVDGPHVKLRSASAGTFLRANGGVPPWRNSVTHDVPHRAATVDWVLWEVHVVEVVNLDNVEVPLTPPPAGQPRRVARSDSFGSETSFASSSDVANGCSRQESSDSIVLHSPPKLGGNGRVIYYHIADEHGNVINDEDGQGKHSLNFKGNNVKELAHKLSKYTGIEDIAVCTRSPLNGKLCPLRLQLPPNTLSMHVVVIPSTSLVAKNLETMGLWEY